MTKPLLKRPTTHRAAAAGPPVQCDRCKAWYASGPKADALHQCPPRWEVRDTWGQLLIDPRLEATSWPLLVWGIDPGAAAENAVLELVQRGEVAESCGVYVRQRPDGVWLRVMVRVDFDWYDDQHSWPGFGNGECEVTIGAQHVTLVAAPDRKRWPDWDRWRAPA